MRFPRKEPLTDARHVRTAIARFDQTIDVSDEDRELAFANIKEAAEYYGVDMTETDWTQLGTTPHTGRTAEDRKTSAREAAATRKRDRLGEAKDCLLKRQIESRRIEEIARQTLPLLSEMRDGLDDQARVNRLIAKVDQLRVKMDAYGQTYDLVTQLTQQTELDRFHSDRKLAASRLSGLDRQRHQLDRDIANVEAVIEAAGEFSRLMDESIAAVDLFARDGEREAA